MRKSCVCARIESRQMLYTSRTRIRERERVVDLDWFGGADDCTNQRALCPPKGSCSSDAMLHRVQRSVQYSHSNSDSDADADERSGQLAEEETRSCGAGESSAPLSRVCCCCCCHWSLPRDARVWHSYSYSYSYWCWRTCCSPTPKTKCARYPHWLRPARTLLRIGCTHRRSM